MKLSSKTHLCQQRLKDYIDALDIAGYLREEVYHTFEYVNYYKSCNLLDHKEDFAVYLQNLDKENSRLMTSLLQPYTSIDTQEHVMKDCSYYLSSSCITTLGNTATLLVNEIYPEISTQATKIINTLKAILLFTITEYLHASALRMGIHSARKKNKH